LAFPTTVDSLVDGQSTERASQVLGPQRIVVGPAWVNVMSDQWGGTFDGVTDVAAALQAAENAAQTAGATVYYPPAVYPCSTAINVYGRVKHLGAGIENTILKLRTGASTTTPLIQTNGFASLAAGGGGAGAGTSTGGEVNFMFDSMTLDGNKANVASTVPLMRLYGYGFRIEDVVFRNGNNVGLYSEWSTSLPSPGNDSMMSFLVNLKSHDHGSHGVHWKGPHDTQWSLGEVYNNGGRGIFADAKGDGLILFGVHSWGLTQTYACYFGATGCGASGCVFEGASTAQLALDANDCWTIGGFIYGFGVITAPVGIEIGTGGTRQDLAVWGTKINNCTSGSLKFVNDGGALIAADVYQASGTPTTGTISALTHMMLRANGVAGTVSRFPGQVEIHGGNLLRLYQSGDSGWADLSFDGSRANLTWPFQTAAGQYLKAGGMLRRTVQTPAHSATPTPNVALGSIFAPAAMTGNVTVGAPTNGAAGDELLCIWLQDGTGTRTVTYNAVYKTTGTGAVTAITTGANTRTIDKFVTDDGTNWRLVSRITGQ
jgi:hypothetical protein